MTIDDRLAEIDLVIAAMNDHPCHAYSAEKQAVCGRHGEALAAEVRRLRDELDGTIQLGNQAREELTVLRQRHAEMEAKRNALFEEATAIKRSHAEELDSVWADIAAGWDIEDRAFFEAEVAKGNGFGSALAMALHYIWKRDPKVAAAVEAAFREGWNTDHEAWLRGEDAAWLASEAKARLT